MGVLKGFRFEGIWEELRSRIIILWDELNIDADFHF